MVASILLAGVVVVLMCVPLLSGLGSSSLEVETASISDYDADFEVDADGTMSVTERLQVDLPFGKRGIFRFFDTVDVADPHVRYVPYDLEVTRNGSPDGTDLTREGGGRYQVLRIGREDTYIDGPQLYEIRYKVDGVLADRDGRSVLYWNLVPSGWRMPIARTTLSVSLPGAPGEVRCAVGVGAQRGCEATISGDGFTVETGALAPNTPVTIQTDVDVDPPGQHTLPWTYRLDPVLGRSLPVALAVGALAVLAALAGALIGRSVREPEPPFPLQYAPPDGLGPAQAAYLFTERIDDDLYTATVLDLAARGVITLERAGDGWTLTPTDRGWDDVDEIGRAVGSRLGLDRGATFVLDPKDTVAGQELRTARTGFRDVVKGWSRSKGLLEVQSLPALAGAGLVIAALIAGAMFFANPFAMSLLGLPFGWFAVTVWPVLTPGATTIRTAKGRDLWSRIGGFRRVLATPSAQARFDFSGREELYTAYIPWAVAFGVADRWAEKYRVETGLEPPVPSYVGGYYAAGGFHGSAVAAMTHDFNASVDSAVSAYEATLAPKSGSGGGGSFGGGGFSGGGGGGGGGGGSW